jgi:hypothetical protein
MKPYPLELRQRSVEAVDQQYDTIEEVAAMFGALVVFCLAKLGKPPGEGKLRTKKAPPSAPGIGK